MCDVVEISSKTLKETTVRVLDFLFEKQEAQAKVSI